MAAVVTFTGGVYTGSVGASSGNMVTQTCAFNVTVPAGTNFMWVYANATTPGGGYYTVTPTFNGVTMNAAWTTSSNDGMYWLLNPPIGTYSLTATIYAQRGALSMMSQCFGNVNTVIAAYYHDTSGSVGASPYTTNSFTANPGSAVGCWAYGGDWHGTSSYAVSPTIQDAAVSKGWTDYSGSPQQIYQTIFRKDASAGGTINFSFTHTNFYLSPYWLWALQPKPNPARSQLISFF